MFELGLLGVTAAPNLAAVFPEMPVYVASWGCHGASPPTRSNYPALMHPCYTMPGVVQVERRPHSATYHSAALAWDQTLGFPQDSDGSAFGRVSVPLGDGDNFGCRNYNRKRSGFAACGTMLCALPSTIWLQSDQRRQKIWSYTGGNCGCCYAFLSVM